MSRRISPRQKRSQPRPPAQPLALEPLESRTLMSAAVFSAFSFPTNNTPSLAATAPTVASGKVEVFSATTISGYAYSPANGEAPVTVIITVDGIASVLTANLNRPDLATKYPTTNHGFSFSMPALATGTHSVTVAIIDPATNSEIRIKTGSIIIAPPTGAVEVLTSRTISGWAFSAAYNAAPVNVVITIDGVATTITANISRSDMQTRFGSPNHGFSFAMPNLATGTHSVTVDVIDPSSGSLKRLRTSTLNIAPPTGAVEVFTSNVISGWAFSGANAAAPIQVIIIVDGVATTLTADDTRSDLVRRLGDANHGFSFSMPPLSTGAHSVTVDIVDPSNAQLTRIKTGTITIAPATGMVEVLTAAKISGYAFSAANNNEPVDVIITLNGNATTISATGTRTDKQKMFGTSAVGFSYTVPSLATGTHSVTVDIVDPSTGAVTRIKTGTITIAPPTGMVQVFKNTVISGYAFSAANSAAPINVIITINGNAATILADDARPDLVTKLGSPNHGFSYAMPALNTGANTVTIDIVDPSNGNITRIKSGTITIGPPAGMVTTFTTSTIAGWAINPADSAAAMNIVITINGVATTIEADDYSTKLPITYGAGYHGFTYSVPALRPGANTVTVDLVDPYTNQTLRLKSGTLNNAAPIGAVDIATDTQIAGWATDLGMTGPLLVRIDVNGTPMGEPFLANNSRKLSGTMNVGFDVSGNFAGKVVEVYAYDSSNNSPVLIWTNNHAPRGAVTSASASIISGWASDSDNLASPISVRVDIDGITLTTVVASLPRPDVQAAAGATNVGFSVTIPGLTPGTHTITVYAIDGQANSKAPVLIGTATVTNAPPTGEIEVLNPSVISGWALDPDMGTSPATVNIYVDDMLFETVQANLSHAAQPGHGFSVSLASVPAGSHSITVTVLDNRTSDQQEVVIFDDFINNHVPIGALESVTGTTITGWAQDPDAPTSPAAVDIYVDGVYYTTVTANISRPDLVATLGSANHGFSLALPPLSFGSHRIDAYAAESQGNVSSLIGTRTVVNNRPIGAIESLTPTTITGWAADPDRPSESLTMAIMVNGVPHIIDIADKSRPDLVATLGSANHGFVITLSLSPGVNTVDLFALDKNNNQLLSLIGTQTITVP